MSTIHLLNCCLHSKQNSLLTVRMYMFQAFQFQFWKVEGSLMGCVSQIRTYEHLPIRLCTCTYMCYLVVVVDMSLSSMRSTSRTASSSRSLHSSLWLGKIQSLPTCLWKNLYNRQYPRSSQLSVRSSVYVVYIFVFHMYLCTQTCTCQYSEFLLILHFLSTIPLCLNSSVCTMIIQIICQVH